MLLYTGMSLHGDLSFDKSTDIANTTLPHHDDATLLVEEEGEKSRLHPDFQLA